jgi:hypothetical protein
MSVHVAMYDGIWDALYVALMVAIILEARASRAVLSAYEEDGTSRCVS